MGEIWRKVEGSEGISNIGFWGKIFFNRRRNKGFEVKECQIFLKKRKEVSNVVSEYLRWEVVRDEFIEIIWGFNYIGFCKLLKGFQFLL